MGGCDADIEIWLISFSNAMVTWLSSSRLFAFTDTAVCDCSQSEVLLPEESSATQYSV